MSEPFEALPGIGPVLARRLREALGVRSLSALTAAARAGRLEQVPGVGPRRAELIRRALADRLLVDAHPPPVGVDVLLGLDAEFRRAEGAGELARVPPPRDDPARGWRAVLHRRAAGRDWVIHWSDSARARELGRDRDWVVVRSEDPDEGLAETVVTERAGVRAGRRVVRGREEEC